MSVVGPRVRARNSDLKSHLKRLLIYKGRKSHLSLEYLLGLYEQQGGLCALTGMKMTWGMGLRYVPTHVSIDRIDSFGSYTPDNVQLVCRIANSMKLNLGQSEFIKLCRKIVERSDAGN